ncbi:uncharacterized protein LODBEIA_P24230 [Lodderomyces beijingensis]|uniref:Sister chromatid cohesion protein PDS5 n=1 Tax=Lodderomyces beijingensis TaxID=1775926 RepID=A0ABP0ZJ80_9ASCO
MAPARTSRRSSKTHSDAYSRPSSGSLSFDKPILSTIKRSISTKEQLARVSELHEKLSNLEDAEVDDLDSLRPYALELIDKKLLNHTSVGVQAFVCCCIADILRLFAPNAPYSEEELSELFKAFIKQFSRIGSAKNDKPQFYPQYVYLLKRIAETKTFILMMDLPDSGSLIESFFQTFYGVATKESFPSELETLVADILTEITNESENIPHEIVKLILGKFTLHEAKSGALANQVSSPEFNFSLSICEGNVDRMSRSVAQYFSEILYRNVTLLEQQQQPDSEDSTRKDYGKGKIRAEAMEVLTNIHRLSVQIWKFVPSIMSSVMSLLEDELNASEEKVRALATKSIGEMLGSAPLNSSVPHLKVNFFIIHKSTWAAWLRKPMDVSALVRSSWVTSLPEIWKHNQFSTTQTNQQITAELKKCSVDSDHKVREATCQTIAKIPFRTLVSKVLDESVMTTLFQLMREKHKSIRSIAIDTLGSIYKSYIDSQMASNPFPIDVALERCILDIPNQILHLVYINDKNINALVDLSLFEKLVPVAETNSVIRVEKLVRFFKVLDRKGKEAFKAINGRQGKFSSVVLSLMQLADECVRANSIQEKENRPSSDEIKSNCVKIDKILNWLCASFADDCNTYPCLERLVKLNRARFYNLIKICISCESDMKIINNALNELLTKVSEPKNIKLGDVFGVSATDMVFNIKLLLLRSSPVIYNTSNVEQLIEFSKSREHEHHAAATEILEQISNVNPDVFKFHIRSLSHLCRAEIEAETEAEREAETKPKEDNFTILRTMYHFIKKYPNSMPPEVSFLETLKELAVKGSPDSAKYALKLIGRSESKELCCAAIAAKIFPLDIERDHLFATHLSSFAEMFLVDRFSVSKTEVEAIPYIIKNVLLQNSEHDKASNLKLLALRTLINSLRSASVAHDTELAREKAAPVIKLLISIIGNSGEIVSDSNPTWPTPDDYKIKLRLAAGENLLKLTQLPVYNEVILSPTLRKLCFLVNDDELSVRQKFVERLRQKLAEEAISEKYLPLVFFSASDPNEELKTETTRWISSMLRRSEAKNNLKFEKALVRLIHGLAHNEVFEAILLKNVESESDPSQRQLNAYIFASVYLIYYVQLVAKSENISLLYYFASRVKQHRDAAIASCEYEKREPSEEVLSIYRIAELAQLILKMYSDHRNWPIYTWSDKIKLPQELYALMTTSQEAQRIVSQIFIPENVQEPLAMEIKKTMVDSKRKRNDNESSTTSTTTKRAKMMMTQVKVKKTKPKSKKPKRPIKKVVFAEPTRKSARASAQVNYRDQMSSEESSESESDF